MTDENTRTEADFLRESRDFWRMHAMQLAKELVRQLRDKEDSNGQDPDKPVVR